jgi:hypothetical protein
MATYNHVSDGRPDGVLIGNAVADAVGFHGTAPTAQRAGAAQAALTLTTATVGGTGFTTASGFTALIAQIEEIRAALVAKGLIKGAA